MVLALFGWGCVFCHCTEVKHPPTEAQRAAEGAYGAELLACVERANTLAESKACRAEVDKRWGVIRKDAAP
jgi:hypothetical protein